MKYASFAAAFALLSAGPLLAHPRAKPSTEAADQNKVVCKRMVETGSLVKGSRTCKTKQTWQREAEAARRMGQEMQDSSLINSNAPQ